jgi:hypothetical protein
MLREVVDRDALLGLDVRQHGADRQAGRRYGVCRLAAFNTQR